MKTKKLNGSSEKCFDEKFRIMHFLDSIRWQNSGNYYTINCAYPNKSKNIALTDDEKLLTHWLLYVTDRQMSFRRIWDVGGIVISELAHSFTQEESDNPFEVIHGYFNKIGDNYTFKGKLKYNDLNEDQKKRLKPYYTNNELDELCNNNGTIEFKSRFLTNDFLCMLYTLYTLSDARFGGSLTKYLALVVEKIYNNSQITDKVQYSVLGMAFALHRLTYEVSFTYKDQRVTYKPDDFENKQLNIDSFIKNKFSNYAEKHLESIKSEIFDAEDAALVEAVNTFFGLNEKGTKSKKKYESMKRTWCALRDYLKSPLYKPTFTNQIRKHLSKSSVPTAFLDELFCDKDNSFNACRWLELPGDVWNENSTFRRCITNKRAGKLGELLRNEFNQIYKNGSIPHNGYPEEFDTTFDFVPKMCELDNCSICPFNAVNGETINQEKLDSLCVETSGKYCPLVLLYCGYFHKCPGSKQSCKLMEFFNVDNKNNQ